LGQALCADSIRVIKPELLKNWEIDFLGLKIRPRETPDSLDPFNTLWNLPERPLHFPHYRTCATS